MQAPGGGIEDHGGDGQDDGVEEALLAGRHHVDAEGDLVLVVAEADVVGEAAGEDEGGALEGVGEDGGGRGRVAGRRGRGDQLHRRHRDGRREVVGAVGRRRVDEQRERLQRPWRIERRGHDGWWSRVVIWRDRFLLSLR